MTPDVKTSFDLLSAAAQRPRTSNLPLAIALQDAADPQSVLVIFAAQGTDHSVAVPLSDWPAFAPFVDVP